MRGHDNQAVGLARDEHGNGQSPVAESTRQTVGPGVARLRTRSVVRRIDPWSVLKVSVVFYIAVYCILLVAAVLLWFAATDTGLRANIEKVIADLIASGKFHFVGSELLRAGVIGGAMIVVLGTAANVMLCVLYNLISDLVGGMSIVVEERPVRRVRRAPPRTRATEQRAAEPDRAVSQPVPEPMKILIPEIERRTVRTPELQPQASQSQPQPSQSQPQPSQSLPAEPPQPPPPQPQAQQPSLLQPRRPQPQPQLVQPQPQVQPPQPRPQPSPRPWQLQPPPQPIPLKPPQAEPAEPRAAEPRVAEGEAPEHRLAVAMPASSPDEPDQQLSGAERASGANLEAFGL